MSDERGGWSWVAFLLDPFWYFSKGMYRKGFWLLIISVFSGLLAAPFIWIYCGAKGQGDWYDFKLKTKSKVDLKSL